MSRLINSDGALQFYRKPSREIAWIVIINTTVVQVSGVCVYTEVTLTVSQVGLPVRITALTLPASLLKDTIVCHPQGTQFSFRVVADCSQLDPSCLDFPIRCSALVRHSRAGLRSFRSTLMRD